MPALVVDTATQAKGETKYTVGSTFSEDMNDILAPSMEDDEYADFTDRSTLLHAHSSSQSFHNTFSTDDSILRMVEKETSVARDESEKDSVRNIILNSTISFDDMEQILQTLTSADKDEYRQPEVVLGNDFSLDGSTRDMTIASDSSSFDQVMFMIDSEFNDAEIAIEATFMGKSELFIHKEEEGDDDITAPTNKQDEVMLKRGDMDHSVESLSDGVSKVSVRDEEEKKMDEDIPSHQEKEVASHKMDLSSECKDKECFKDNETPQPEALQHSEQVEGTPQSDISSAKSVNTQKDNKVDDPVDEEQAVVKWAQLLAESSLEGDPTLKRPSDSEKSNILASESLEKNDDIAEKPPTPLSCKPPPSPSPRAQRFHALGSPASSVSTRKSLEEFRALCAQKGPMPPNKDPAKQLREVYDEQPLLKAPRNIRFRKGFPDVKPVHGPRPNDDIIQSHSHGIPTPPIIRIKPKAELKQLIVAAMGPSLQRRSNACGALKVLSLRKKNQLSLARTDTFLTALVFAIRQDISNADNELAIAARIRALTCLRHVTLPKENRVHVFTQPGLVECLINVINTDKRESRGLACATLALLAKSLECREGLGVVPGLVDCLSHVVGPIVASEDDPVDEACEPIDDEDDSSTETDSHSGSDSTSKSSGGSSSASSQSSEGSENDGGNSETEVEDEETDTENEDEDVPIHTDLEKSHQDARLNACAALVHLSRSCAISHVLSKNTTLLRTCVKVTMEITNPVHSKCLEILLNLTLFPGNNSFLSRSDGVITTFTASASSQYPENRLSALRALQNLSGDASSKVILASAHVLHLLTSCAIRSDPNEKEAALATLYNITTDPSTLVAITSTKNVIATLVHLAHHTESSSQVRLLACEALATISLWLQNVASAGTCPEGVPNVLLPSHKTYGWDRWD